MTDCAQVLAAFALAAVTVWAALAIPPPDDV